MSRSTSTRKLEKEFPAVITGASSGIGKALALRLARRYRARLVINARSVEQLAVTKEAVEKLGGHCLVVPGDLAEPGLAASLVDRCLEEYGGIHLLVNNAGLARPGQILDLDTDDWRRVFEVNFFAALEATYRALPEFKKQAAGKIVNISSVAGKVAFAGSVCYAASKHALTAMSTGMAAELARDGIDILTVSPGWVRTEFFEKNSVDDAKNPTLIASRNDAAGLLMRYVLSISPESVAEQIEKNLNRGGSHEMIMTAPGKLVERLQALAPGLVFSVNSRLPVSATDSRDKSKALDKVAG